MEPSGLNRQEVLYQKAMRNIQVLYAHNHTFTLRIDSLTPGLHETQPVPELLDRTVAAFLQPQGAVVDVALRELRSTDPQGCCGASCGKSCAQLHANTTPYSERGWCAAETQWSVAREASWKSIILPFQNGAATRAPMAPEDFQTFAKKGLLRFTHRADLEPVVDLQAKVRVLTQGW